MERCKFPDGVAAFKPDGVHDLDPCLYEIELEVHNVRLRVLKCIRCGHREFEWEYEDNIKEDDDE